MTPTVTRRAWGTSSQQDDDVLSDISLFVVESSSMRLSLSDFGATLTRVEVRTSSEDWVDVTVGYEALSPYTEPTTNRYFGGTVGRVANRTALGTFVTGAARDVTQLPINNGPNSLHGGIFGFNRRVWETAILSSPTFAGVQFTRVAADGEEGFPSSLRVTATYGLGVGVTGAWNDIVMRFDSENTGTKTTHANVVNHSYWNLDGLKGRSSSESGIDVTKTHSLWLNAPWYTPASDTLIPTGEVRSVVGTAAMDFFTAPKVIGETISMLDDTPFRGYDHNFVLKRDSVLSPEERDAFYNVCMVGSGVTEESRASWALGRLSSTQSGITADIYSSFPAVQFYSGNFLPQADDASSPYPPSYYNTPITYRSAVCLEAQYFPNSANVAHFPTTVLHPGQRRVDYQVYSFTVRPPSDGSCSETR